MTPLRVIMGKGGFELRMVRRQGRAGIYRQHLPGGNPDHDAYEVIMFQFRNTNYKGEPVENPQDSKSLSNASPTSRIAHPINQHFCSKDGTNQ